MRQVALVLAMVIAVGAFDVGAGAQVLELREARRHTCIARVEAEATIAGVRLSGRELDEKLDAYLEEVTETAFDDMVEC